MTNQIQNQIEWRPVVIERDGVVYDFSTEYLVSEEGKVYSIKSGKVLKQHKNNKGYWLVGLCHGGIMQKFLVHRLVASAFCDNPLELPQVNHLDENKDNNHFSNLCWCTAEENNNWGSKSKRQIYTKYLNKMRKGVVRRMKEKTLLIDGKEVNVKTARIIIEDDGGVVLRFGFKKVDTNFGERARREYHHIEYGDFDFDGVCLFHYDFMLVRFI